MTKNNLKILIATIAVAMNVAAFAQNSPITVHVEVLAPKTVNNNIRAVGFSANNNSQGSLGTSTTKKTNRGAFTFGLKTKKGHSVNCGRANLSKDSVVKLYYNGKSCHISYIYSYSAKNKEK